MTEIVTVVHSQLVMVKMQMFGLAQSMPSQPPKRGFRRQNLSHCAQPGVETRQPAVMEPQQPHLLHMGIDSDPQLTKGQCLREGLPGCEGHLQHSLVLFVIQCCVLRHVDSSFADCDVCRLIMAMLGGGLHLEVVLLQHANGTIIALLAVPRMFASLPYDMIARVWPMMCRLVSS